MKDEYVGLRPKMYFIKKVNDSEIKKAMGVKKYVVKNHIRHSQYCEALFSSKVFKHEMNTLRSVGHQIYTLKMNKTSLSPLDTKRWIADDGITTYGYGYNPTYGYGYNPTYGYGYNPAYGYGYTPAYGNG